MERLGILQGPYMQDYNHIPFGIRSHPEPDGNLHLERVSRYRHGINEIKELLQNLY